MDILGNELADRLAAAATEQMGRNLITAEGWKALVQKERKEGMQKEGYGDGVHRWHRAALTGYTWCRTNKGPISTWLHFTGRATDGQCHLWRG